MELQCKVQNYEWGKLGRDSEVARLASVCNKALSIEDEKPYAELWMGTHVNAPSYMVDTDEPLTTWLQRNLESLGPETRKAFGDDLPFLFKVLSVRKALSIQAHPNKKHAEELHKNRPDVYRDPNHKPELAVALTPFQALCGFRNIAEIQQFIKAIPELAEVLGESISSSLLTCDKSNERLHLKNAFRKLMQCDASVINGCLTKAIKRLDNDDKQQQEEALFALLKRLSEEFPGDRGCWVIYFLNYLNLQPGEAIFLGPNVPHAYLYGDCVECMACSDNVVRAGLTPKYIDVDTLIEMLIYDSQSPDQIVFRPEIEDNFTKSWRPPVEDFAVSEIRIPSTHFEEYNTIMRPSASILLIISGKASVKDSVIKDVTRGSVLYLKASRQLTIWPDKECKDDLIIYQAMCNFK